MSWSVSTSTSSTFSLLSLVVTWLSLCNYPSPLHIGTHYTGNTTQNMYECTTISTIYLKDDTVTDQENEGRRRERRGCLKWKQNKHMFCQGCSDRKVITCKNLTVPTEYVN